MKATWSRVSRMMDHTIKAVFYSFHSVKHLILASTRPGSHKKGRSSNTTFLWIILGPGSGHVKARMSVASKAEKNTRKPVKEQPQAGHQRAQVLRCCPLGASKSWWGWTKALSCIAHSPLEGEAHPGVEWWPWSLFSESKERSLCFNQETKSKQKTNIIKFF